ncbi:hypothetical protein CPC08DRAFT_651784, partial [Agrocybe pediades]
SYPAFTKTNCTWQNIFDRVENPGNLWLSYAPRNLGDYPSVRSLWEAWDEGAPVQNVGRKPALRLIEERWGTLQNEETKKKKYASWRRNLDPTGRKVWANFSFFVERIEQRRKLGHSSTDSVAFFENLREGRSLSQFHRSLQPKRKRALEDVGERPPPS